MGKKFEYTLEDCACEYCLYFNWKAKTCQIKVCCCLEEKRKALARLRSGKARSSKCAA